MTNNTMQCVETECTQEGKPYEIGTLQLILCQYHRYELATKSKERARKVIAELDEIGALAGHTEGWTYVIRLANGNVKIGTTKNPDLIRFQGLSRETNQGVPVHVLAVVKGGLSLEYLFHEKWFSLKVPGQMEAFHADPALLRWAEGLGIDPAVNSERFEQWTQMRHSKGSTGDYAHEMWGDAIGKANEIEKAEEDAFWQN